MSSPFPRKQQQQSSPRRRRRAASGSNVRVNDEDLRASAMWARSSTPAELNTSPVDTGAATALNTTLSYDSESEEDDFRSQRRHKRPGRIIKAGRGLFGRLSSVGSRDADDDEDFDPGDDYPAVGEPDEDDESVSSDECVILTDDEEEPSEMEEVKQRRCADEIDIIEDGSPRASIVQADSARLKAMFAEKRPWRRQSRRDTTLLVAGKAQKSLAVNVLEDEEHDDDEPSPKIERDAAPGLVLAQSRSEEEEDEDESSSASDDDSSSMQSSLSLISDPEEELDFAALEEIPSNFTSQPQVMFPYLSPSLQTISDYDSGVFAYEHALLLRAVMQLLAERDYIGVEADLDDPSCVVKKGPLKKATHAVGRTTWRVKYVEIRPGSLSYFEDSGKREDLGRKTIQLRSSKCVCETVKSNQFAVQVEAGPRRLWMTTSEDERQAWVRAIQDSMIGPGAGDTFGPLDMAPYEVTLDHFQEVQACLFQAKNRTEYMSHAEGLFHDTIRLPMQWFRERVDGSDETEYSGSVKASAHRLMNSSLAGFWRGLKQQSVSINGHEITSTSPHAAERIIGALSRCILEFDKSSPINSPVPISELQSISFSRDIILALLRSRSENESHTAVNYLCQNPTLVSLERLASSESSETISIQVNYATAEDSDHPQRDISGWVGTRQRFGRLWRNRFIVISDGILNVFEHSSPRPHGLRSQLLLSGACASVVEDKPKSEAQQHILLIVSRNQESERQLSFPDEKLLEEWKLAIQKAIDSCPAPREEDSASVEGSRRTAPTPGGRIIKTASENSAKVIKGATDQFVKAADVIRSSIRSDGTHSRTSSVVIKGAADQFMKAADIIRSSMRSSDGPHSRTSSIEMLRSPYEQGEKDPPLALTSSLDSEPVFKQEPTVQVTAESVILYKLVAKQPSADDREEAWITVRAKMLHTFLLSGGSNGRLAKVDELVEMEFREGDLSEEAFRAAEIILTPR